MSHIVSSLRSANIHSTAFKLNKKGGEGNNMCFDCFLFDHIPRLFFLIWHSEFVIYHNSEFDSSISTNNLFMGTFPSLRTLFQNRRTSASSCRTNGKHNKSWLRCCTQLVVRKRETQSWSPERMLSRSL